MTKNLCAVTLIMGFLMIPCVAKGSFFDDSGGKWYLNPGQWALDTSGDPLAKTDLADVDNKLQFTSQGWPVPDSYESDKMYTSKWFFDLNQDFKLDVRFHYDHTGTREDDEAGIGIFLFNNLSNDVWVDLTAGNEYNSSEVKDIANYSSSLITSGEEISWKEWNRYSNDGIFTAEYDAANDILTMRVFDENNTEKGNESYSGLKGLERLWVGLGGTCDGGMISYGEAYLADFNIYNGAATAAPEPVSTALFLIGGAVLVARRFKK